MKKFFYTCATLLMVLCFMQSSTVSAVARQPLYSDPMFFCIEELIEWIETTDAENFQSGRFRDCLLSMRSRGEVIIPSFNNPSLTLLRIEVLPARPNREERMMIAVFYLAPTGQVSVRSSELTPIITEIYEEGGMSSYLAATRGERNESYQILDKTVNMRNSATGEIEELEISYALIDELGSQYFQFARTFFIVDGFELGVTYHSTQCSIFTHYTAWDIAPVAYRPASLIPSQAAQVRPISNTIRFTIGSTNYTINNTPHTTDVAPFLDTVLNRTMIPLRAVAVALGAEVDWFPATRTVHVYTANGVHRLNVGTPLPDGMGIPIMYQNRVFVPIRYVADILDAETRWDRDNLAVYIYQHVTPN